MYASALGTTATGAYGASSGEVVDYPRLAGLEVGQASLGTGLRAGRRCGRDGCGGDTLVGSGARAGGDVRFVPSGSAVTLLYALPGEERLVHPGRRTRKRKGQKSRQKRRLERALARALERESILREFIALMEAELKLKAAELVEVRGLVDWTLLPRE